MQCFEAGQQNGMVVGRSQHIVDQRDGENADGKRGAPRQACREDLLRAIDLLDGNQRNGDAAECGGIGAVAVQHCCHIHA